MLTTLDHLDKTKATCEVAFESTTKKLKHNTKKAAMLKLFIRLGERGLNCFEAANNHHDYVLRSTVSDLQLDYGLLFLRKAPRPWRASYGLGLRLTVTSWQSFAPGKRKPTAPITQVPGSLR